MNQNNIYIVNHTHWDREWYRSYNDYAASLKRGIIHLLNQLDNGQIENFYFDGQTIIIEDLAEVLPTVYFDKFISYIKAGTIEVGPWYVLPDEGLVDYVGYQKNLEIGAAICEKYDIPNGKVMYLPDTFGHDASIPRLAADHGLEHAIIHRGVTSSQIDICWSNGDYKVKALVLPTREGYYQTMFHHDNYLEKLEEYIAAYTNKTTSNDVLILNGCDHTFPSDKFAERLADFKVKNPNYNVVQVTLSEFFNRSEYQYDEQLSGELRESGIAFLLPGVLSTRQYLKYQNREVIDLVKNKYEPLAELLTQYDLEQLNINRLWKLIIQNHPHDSICGCSIDEVHREMEVRSQNVLDSATASIRELLNSKYYYDMTRDVFNNNVLVYNHTNNQKFETHLTLYLPHEMETEDKQIEFVSKTNKKYYGEIISSVQIEKLVHDYKHEPDYQFLKETVVSIGFDINPHTFDVFECNLVQVEKRERVEVDYNSYIDNNINYQWITDRGDSYNFDPAGEYSSFINKISAVENHELYSEVKVISTATAKIGFDFTSAARCGRDKVITIETVIKFYIADYQVVNITIDNIHENIKVVNVIKNKGNQLVTSDTALFTEDRKQLSTISYVAPANNTEVNYNQKPSQTKFTIGDEIEIYHLGQNELEVLDGKVITTLFRATGDLSRRDLISRKGGAGPSIATPECQCKRELKFAYLYNYGQNSLDHTNLYQAVVHQFRENNE